MPQQTTELEFYKTGNGVHSVSLKNEQLFWIKEKYKDFSLSQFLQSTLTEETIKEYLKKNGTNNRNTVPK